MPPVNEDKKKFMLQFILNARRAGRVVDTDGEYHRKSIVDAASDLYDRTVEACTSPDESK